MLSEKIDCPECGGKGFFILGRKMEPEYQGQHKPCWTCAGSGNVPSRWRFEGVLNQSGCSYG